MSHEQTKPVDGVDRFWSWKLTPDLCRRMSHNGRIWIAVVVTGSWTSWSEMAMAAAGLWAWEPGGGKKRLCHSAAIKWAGACLKERWIWASSALVHLQSLRFFMVKFSIWSHNIRYHLESLKRFNHYKPLYDPNVTVTVVPYFVTWVGTQQSRSKWWILTFHVFWKSLDNLNDGKVSILTMVLKKNLLGENQLAVYLSFYPVSVIFRVTLILEKQTPMGYLSEETRIKPEGVQEQWPFYFQACVQKRRCLRKGLNKRAI